MHNAFGQSHCTADNLVDR